MIFTYNNDIKNLDTKFVFNYLNTTDYKSMGDIEQDVQCLHSL